MTNSQSKLFLPPASELSWSFARSSGKGGQNVNKVSTKAVLKFHYLYSSVLSDEDKSRLQQLYANKINDLGELTISSERFREQSQNIRDCLVKLSEILIASKHRPKPRKKTKPTKASKKRRLESKKLHSLKKAARKKAEYD